jgi:glycosyltransferase involved in cell wall biosynthesis/ubiquinone/menaquinone biosynthesis C-methylase UbiE
MEIKKPKIVMVIDDPKWAFAISARDMVRFMPQYDFKIISWYDKPSDPAHYVGADLVYLFGHYMHDWMPENFDFSKSCTGVRALFGYLNEIGQEDQTQDPWTADNARHITKFPLIHTVSQESYDIFKDFHPNVEYVCHGVDTEFYAQKKIYTKRKPLVLGWAGNRSNLVKGIDFVIQQLANGRTDTILKMAEFGENQLNAEQLRDFYHDIDVFVLPSLSEGNSAALLEAMSCGLPVIATNTGGWKEFKNLGGGFTMERTSPSWNEALNKVIAMSDSDLKKMGEINRKEMVDHWDWKIKAKGFDAFFQKGLNMPVDSKKTIQMFDDKWKNMPKGYGFGDVKQVGFFMDWAVKKYGVKNIEALNKFYSSKKNILEVGFGSAFNIDYISRLTDGKITGLDSSVTACNLAKEKFAGHKNVMILNRNIMEIDGVPNDEGWRIEPIEDDSYDLIIADGVLHHLKDTRKAISLLYKKLAKGGHMYVYLYKKMGRVREFTNDYLRFQFKNMKAEECIRACESLTVLGRELSSIKTKIKIDAIPILGLEAGEYTPQEIMYYGVIKCFWNDTFDFQVNNMNNYDWFAPEYAWRFTEEEVDKIMKEIGCEYKINQANLNGISILIKKKI